MLTTLSFIVLAAGSYTPGEGTSERPVGSGRDRQPCWAVAPEARFSVDGPGEAGLVLVLDAPAGRAKPKVTALVGLDGRARPHAVSVNRRGEPRPIKLKIPAGAHTLHVALQGGRSGCVILRGLERAAPASTPAVASAPAPPPTPAIAALPLEPPPRPGDPAPAAPPPAAPAAPAPMERIDAAAVPSDAAASEAPSDLAAAPREPAGLHLGAFVGGALPRADLAPGFAFGVLLEAPLDSLGAPGRLDLAFASLDLLAHLALGFSPLGQQDATLIPGRGAAQLIQRSLVFPIDVGLTARLDLGAAVHPYAALGLAVEIVRTRLEAFSVEPIRQNDVAVGPALAGGIYVPLGAGALLGELRYREVGADLGPFDAVGEDTLSTFSLQVGWVFVL